jgi:hypothetical protein
MDYLTIIHVDFNYLREILNTTGPILSSTHSLTRHEKNR